MNSLLFRRMFFRTYKYNATASCQLAWLHRTTGNGETASSLRATQVLTYYAGADLRLKVQGFDPYLLNNLQIYLY